MSSICMKNIDRAYEKAHEQAKKDAPKSKTTGDCERSDHATRAKPQPGPYASFEESTAIR